MDPRLRLHGFEQGHCLLDAPVGTYKRPNLPKTLSDFARWTTRGTLPGLLGILKIKNENYVIIYRRSGLVGSTRISKRKNVVIRSKWSTKWRREGHIKCLELNRRCAFHGCWCDIERKIKIFWRKILEIYDLNGMLDISGKISTQLLV